MRGATNHPAVRYNRRLLWHRQCRCHTGNAREWSEDALCERNPKAPVLVLEAEQDEVRLGGAAGVAMLMAALDCVGLAPFPGNAFGGPG
jgi:hypothetical protein